MADSSIAQDTSVSAASFLTAAIRYLWKSGDDSPNLGKLMKWKDWVDEVLLNLQSRLPNGDGGSISQEYVKDSDGTTVIYFRTVAGTNTAGDKRILHNSSEGLEFQHYNGSSWDSALNMPSATDARFSDGDVLLRVGNGTGSPVLRVIKDTDGIGALQFYSENTPDSGSWRLIHNGDETFSLDRYNGSTWDTVITFEANGMPVLPSFSDSTRGAAGTAGRIIFNTDDAAINVDDGTNWTDAQGTTT